MVVTKVQKITFPAIVYNRTNMQNSLPTIGKHMTSSCIVALQNKHSLTVPKFALITETIKLSKLLQLN